LILEPVTRDEFSAGFFDAAAQGLLAVRRCENNHFLAASLGYMGPALRCPECLTGNIEWVPASGEASLVSWTIVHDKGGGTRTVGMVELAEGPWMLAALGVDSDEELTPNMPLRVDFVRPDGSEALPVFSPM
jgi:uncharacterized OB-fold protein